MIGHDLRFVIGRQIGFDLRQVIVREGQGVVNVSGLQRRILLDDFFNGHALAVTGEYRRDSNARAGHDGLPAAAVRIFHDIAVVQFGHGALTVGLGEPHLRR